MTAPASVRSLLTRSAGALRELSPVAILTIGWAVALLYAFPGQVTWDSVRTLLEARSGDYTDTNPPAFATLWYWAEHVIAGTFGLLLLQTTTFALGVYLIFRRTLQPRAAAWAATGVIVFPPVMAPMAFVWEETLMAGFLAFGTGCLLAPRRSLRALGVVAIFAASALRYDAWIATLPIVVLLFRWRPRIGGLRRYALALAVWLAVSAAAFGVNRALTEFPKHTWHATVALHDIVGTLAFIDHDLADAELRVLLAGTELLVEDGIHARARRVYTARDAASTTTHPQLAMWRMSEFGLDAPPRALRDAIERARGKLITAHRGAYLRHRLAVATQLLWFGTGRSTLVPSGRNFNDNDLLRGMGLATGWSGVQLGLSRAFASVGRFTPLFAPWLYLVLAVILLPFTRRHRDLTALLGSGVLLVGLLALTTASRDSRFTHWMVVCTSVAIVTFLARRRSRAALEEPELVDEPPLRVLVREVPARVRARLGSLSPRAILMLGLVGIVLYAFPGYMSYDSVYQLLEARSGVFSDGHPPVMAAFWRGVDFIIAGPFGILLIQNITFLVGGYLILRERMSARAAAVTATLVLWFPVTSATMGVIWKDSMMAGLLMLGTGLLLQQHRRTRIGGLAVLALATAMRHNALAMTFPIVILLFVWNPAHRWWKRYALSIVAWFAITATAQLTAKAITTVQWHMWHQSLALYDMVGTLRHAPDVSDAELRETLAGTPLRIRDGIQARARTPFPPDVSMVGELWTVTRAIFGPPKDETERVAVARAWKEIVFSHLGAYLAYRWQVFRQLVQLTDVEKGQPVYFFFADVQDPYGSAAKIEHMAVPSQLQGVLRELMLEIGATPLFTVYIYMFLALALLPFAIRDRESLTILLSALSSEAALFFLTPTTDLRYSFWMILSTSLAIAMLVAARMRQRGLSAIRTNSL